MNACHPGVQECPLAQVCEVDCTCQVDGIQRDNRLPAQPVEGGYSDVTRALHAQGHGNSGPPPQ